MFHLISIPFFLCTIYFKLEHFKAIFRHYFTHIQYGLLFCTTAIPLSHLTKFTIIFNILSHSVVEISLIVSKMSLQSWFVSTQ